MPEFQGVGRWLGCAEVYGGDGRFLGNGTDTRNVETLGEGRIRIDVAFIGPLKASGHYFVQDNGDHRLYQGPINVGYAETLANNLVDANAYWASIGLTQRFFLMVIGDMQLSLALMSRGEHLLYAIVGENQRVYDTTSLPTLVSGTSFDFQDDPTAGRGELVLHRTGKWVGDVTTLNAQRDVINTAIYTETRRHDQNVQIIGSHFAPEQCYDIKTNGWHGWTPSGAVVGSYSLSGGRALSGTFYMQTDQLRVWKREVVCQSGDKKAIVNHWYRGGERVGTEFGLLEFRSS